MPTIDDLKRSLPPETRVIFDTIWEKIPSAEKKTFVDLIQALPSRANMLQLLFKIGADHLKITFGHKHKIAIVGPANVGKSTLYNQLIQNKQDRALVGPLPGTTRDLQVADAGIFAIVDTPGGDAIGDVGEKEREIALNAAADADLLIIMFDAIQGIKQTELDLYYRLTNLGKPYVVVLNKQDMVKRDIKFIQDHAAKALNLSTDQILSISARSGENISELLKIIAATEPQIIAALGKALPQYRWQLAWRTIASAASVSAAIALTPLPVIDFLPLLATQSVMVLGIARIYNYKITLARAKELVVSFGLGFLGRTIFYELSKLGGIPGWILSVAVAVSITVVMGYAAVIWFEHDKRLTNEHLHKIISQLTKSIVEYVKGVFTRKPGKQGIKEAIENLLLNISIAKDQSAIERPIEEIILPPDRSESKQGS